MGPVRPSPTASTCCGVYATVQWRSCGPESGRTCLLGRTHRTCGQSRLMLAFIRNVRAYGGVACCRILFVSTRARYFRSRSPSIPALVSAHPSRHFPSRSLHLRSLVCRHYNSLITPATHDCAMLDFLLPRCRSLLPTPRRPSPPRQPTYVWLLPPTYTIP